MDGNSEVEFTLGLLGMKAQDFEWVSASLPEEQLRSLLTSLPSVLNELAGDCLLKAMYGWGSNLHIDLCYVPMRVGTKWVDRFIKESLEQRIVVPANSDLYFEFPDERLEILFCHEGDIHVCGPDEELRGRLFNSDCFRGLSFTSRRKKAQQNTPADAAEPRG